MARQHDAAADSRAWLSRDAARTAATWAVVWLAFLLLAWLAWQLKVILALVFVAILLAAAISQPVHLLEGRLGLPRIAAVAICYLVLLALAAGAVWLIVPPLVEQAADLVAAIPEIASRVIEWTRGAVSPIVPADTFDQALNELPARIGEVLSGQGVIGAPLVLIGIVVNVVIVVFLSAFLVIDGGSLWKALIAYAAPERRDRLSTVAGNVVDRLGSYVSGQLLIMLITGTGVAIGMLIIGVPFVLPMGVLAFLTEAIPIAGPFISGIPIVLLAFTEGPVPGLLMAGWILVLQQLEGYVLIPLVQNRVIRVSPTIVLIGVVAGGALAGVLGAVIAIPLVAVIQVIMSEVVLPARRRTWQNGEAASGGPAAGPVSD